MVHKSFRWPDQADEILAYAAEMAPGHDVWGAVLLRSDSTGRTNDNALGGRVVWSDADAHRATSQRDEVLARTEHFAVSSGTPGNLQVYVRLAELTEPARLRRAVLRLIGTLGSDHVQDAARVLRIPGTLNHKPCSAESHQCNPVTWHRPPGTTAGYTPREFIELFSVTAQDLADELPDPPDEEPIEKLTARERRALASPHNGDPSDHTFYLACVGVRALRTDGQLVTLLEQDEITQERWAAKAHLRNHELRAIPPRARQAVAEERQQETAASRHPDGQPAIVGSSDTEGASVTALRAIPGGRAGDDEDEKRGPAKDRLLVIARRDYDLGIMPGEVPYAVRKDGPRLARTFKGGGGLRSQLARTFERETGHAPNQNALTDVIVVLEAEAADEEPAELPLRTAWSEGRLVLDLGDRTGRAVVISEDGWEVADRSPVLFLRTGLTMPLPLPARGGSLSEHLLPFLNVAREDRKLLIAVALSWLWPEIDHPVLYLHGPEGTGKSTVTEILRSLADPSVVKTRRQPAKDEDWEVTIKGQWIIALNNLSGLPDWLSDAICTAVDGTAGDVKRKKFSDQDLSALQVRRCIVLNSIDRELPARGDLVDRLVPFEMLPMQDFRKRTGLDTDWELAQPLALGAMLDLACKVLAVLPESGQHSRFRMGDFAAIAAAIDRQIPGGTSALARYGEVLAASVSGALESDAFAVELVALARQPGGWQGTTTDLFAQRVAPHLSRATAHPTWPKNPAETGKRINRLRGTLRKSGVSAELRRTRQANVWILSETVTGSSDGVT